MSARRPAPATIADLRWLDKSQAMAYTHHFTEKSFDEDFGMKVNRYKGGRCLLYDKKELDRRMLQLVQMKGIDL